MFRQLREICRKLVFFQSGTEKCPVREKLSCLSPKKDNRIAFLLGSNINSTLLFEHLQTDNEKNSFCNVQTFTRELISLFKMPQVYLFFGLDRHLRSIALKQVWFQKVWILCVGCIYIISHQSRALPRKLRIVLRRWHWRCRMQSEILAALGLEYFC